MVSVEMPPQASIGSQCDVIFMMVHGDMWLCCLAYILFLALVTFGINSVVSLIKEGSSLVAV